MPLSANQAVVVLCVGLFGLELMVKLVVGGEPSPLALWLRWFAYRGLVRSQGLVMVMVVWYTFGVDRDFVALTLEFFLLFSFLTQLLG